MCRAASGNRGRKRPRPSQVENRCQVEKKSVRTRRPRPATPTRSAARDAKTIAKPSRSAPSTNASGGLRRPVRPPPNPAPPHPHPHPAPPGAARPPPRLKNRRRGGGVKKGGEKKGPNRRGPRRRGQRGKKTRRDSAEKYERNENHDRR